MIFFLVKCDLTGALNSLYLQSDKSLALKTAEGLLAANYDFTIIIHYVLAITVINQLCKQLEI